MKRSKRRMWAVICWGYGGLISLESKLHTTKKEASSIAKEKNAMYDPLRHAAVPVDLPHWAWFNTDIKGRLV